MSFPRPTALAGGNMFRERALKVVLVLVGLLFVAGTYPIITSLWGLKEPDGETMMLSIYVTLGIFLLLATRNPSASRNIIAFTAWSSFAHGGVMTVMAYQLPKERMELLIAVALFAVIGAVLLALAPAKQSIAPRSAATAQ